MRKTIRILLAGLLLTTSACEALDDLTTPRDPSWDYDALANPEHPGLEGCAAGDVEAELEIARAVERSAHEMITCGGLAAGFSTSFVSLFQNVLQGEWLSPSGLVYVGEGRYLAGTTMTLTARLGKDTSYGARGDAVPFDVFDLLSYARKLVVSTSYKVSSSGEQEAALTFGFEDPGPGVELLGLPPGTEGPIALSLEEVRDALETSLFIDAEVTLDDEQSGAIVHYILRSRPLELGALLAGEPLGWELASMEAENAALGQTMRPLAFDVRYLGASDGIPRLEGHAEFAIEGGAFDYGLRLDMPEHVTLSCRE